MKKEDIKEGVFIHWVANRYLKTWNTYGIVTKVTEDDFFVKTFDDLKETELSFIGDSFKTEITIAKKSAVEDYIALNKIELLSAREKLLLEHKKQLRDFDDRAELINNITI